ncbi:MAG: acyl-CoA thioesterase [Dysgonamonadaceae bacterium]|jgi:acyl-CoA thioester hydrolase|nr:acyl-CoA thioesterase [Dysgonamonadaceae bacterium]
MDLFYCFKPNFSDIDAMNVVHHSRHFIWFENARFVFLENIIKMNRSDFAQLGVAMPVIEANCCYKNMILFEHKIRIETKMYYSKVGRFAFKYRMYCNDENTQYVAEGYTKHVFVSSDTKKLIISIPPLLIEKINMAKALYPNLFLPYEN